MPLRAALILTLAAFALGVAVVHPSPLIAQSSAQATAASSSDSTRSGEWIRTPSGLSYRVLSKGMGPAARGGESVTIHEITTLSNGTVVFSSREKNVPVTFLLGGKQVIAGVDEGVTGMQAGERRLLIIPPSLSVRSSYPPNTPRDSTLHIDLELLSIKRP